jgi:hypothetical protein
MGDDFSRKGFYCILPIKGYMEIGNERTDDIRVS